MKTAAIVQARMGSTRLPGKVMKRLASRPMLEQVLLRLGHARRLDQVIVATTRQAEDGVIARLVARLNVPCVRGSSEDVLGRYHEAALLYGVDVVVRITADCPLIDPQVIDDMLQDYVASIPPYDYFSNTVRRTFPRGLDVEVFPFRVLAQVHQEATSPWDREHVTPYIISHPERFRIGQFLYSEDLSACRLTVDTPDDLRLVRRIYRQLHRDGHLFLLKDILALLRRQPQLLQINRHVCQALRPGTRS